MRSERMALFTAADQEALRVDEGFHVAKFIDNFELLAGAKGGVEGLRALTLHLAIQGHLAERDRTDTSTGAVSPGLTVPYEAPTGWAWRRVDEVGEVKLGRQRSPQNHTGAHMRSYLRVANVHEARIDTSDVLQMNFAPEEAERFLLKVGDVLLNEGQSYELVGRPAIYNGEVPGACFQNTLIRFRPSDVVLSAFALIVFRAYMRTGRFRREAQQTTNIAHLSAGRLAAIEFPLPPLAEQKRIVAKVDELMRMLDDLEAKQAKKREVQGRLRTAALDALTSAEGPEEFEAAWERVAGSWEVLFDRAESVGGLRATLLNLAVTGRLIRPVENSASIVRGQLANGNLRVKHEESDMRDQWREEGGWLHTPLAALLREPLANGRSVPDRAGGFPVLRLSALRGRQVDFSEHKEGDWTATQAAPFVAKDGDMLFVRGNGSIRLVGRACLVSNPPAEIAFPDTAIRARARPDVLDTAWFWFVWESQFVRRQVEASAKTTAGIFKVSQDRLYAITLPVPTLAEQHRIVAKVDHLMNLCDALEAKLKAKEQTSSKLVEAVVKALVA